MADNHSKDLKVESQAEDEPGSATSVIDDEGTGTVNAILSTELPDTTPDIGIATSAGTTSDTVNEAIAIGMNSNGRENNGSTGQKEIQELESTLDLEMKDADPLLEQFEEFSGFQEASNVESQSTHSSDKANGFLPNYDQLTPIPQLDTSLPQFYSKVQSNESAQTQQQTIADYADGHASDHDILEPKPKLPYKKDFIDEDSSEIEFSDEIPSDERSGSRLGSLLSVSEDMALSLTPSPRSPGTPDSSRGGGAFFSPARSIRYIDQRFHTRLSSLSDIQYRSKGPDVSSFSSTLTVSNNIFDNLLDNPASNESPWEAVRWNKLRKMSNQVYSESATSVYGAPTCVLPSATIAIGTTKGLVLIFDYQQNLKHALGLKSKAVECGEVTSLAVSADFTFIAAGYEQGDIFTWDLSKPSSYNLHISPISANFHGNPRFDGHLTDSHVIHLSFVGKHHTALVSGDTNGMVFAHHSIRSVIGRSLRCKRILGKYPQNLPQKHRFKPTTVFACSPLPLGSNVQPTDDMCLVAIMTPYVLAIVSIFPTLQTEFKTGRSKGALNSMGLSGILSWIPALKSTSSGSPSSPARLAYCWSNILHIMEVKAVPKISGMSGQFSLIFGSKKRYICNEPIVVVQWITRQVSEIKVAEWLKVEF